ncbi:VanZ family protein [Mesorhizobium sp. AR10]|uniref:VanZ family protein n=1 Tax=Mesorhizobium sp. AR10 TaxID=2865839 RepID=UPI00215F3242|nr:VanZ family protein [Mesorhizobium sp. AR10]UVK40223.1 VanZ family protein [Mesorhizobium sp. AR10]
MVTRGRPIAVRPDAGKLPAATGQSAPDARDGRQPVHQRSARKYAPILWRIAFWATTAAIAALTLWPLSLRPDTPFGADVERAAATIAFGILAAAAYPGQWPRLILFVLGMVLVLEALQLLTADRHARTADVGLKALGALAGLYVGRVLVLLAERRRAL